MPENKVKPVRYMDFIGTRRAASTDPLISRPKSRPAAPAKSAAKKEEETVKVQKTAEKPMVRRQPAAAKELYSAEAKAELEKRAVKAKTSTKPAEPAEASASKTAKKSQSASEKSPDNNAYSLGGKSPFLPNVSVEKRGLSKSVPEKKKDNFETVSYLGVNDASEKSRKNVYEKKEIIDLESDKPKAKQKTVKIIDNKEKKSGIPLVIIIILTIVLGAAVGTGVYFLLPK